MKYKSLLMIVVLGIATTISACSLLPSNKKDEDEITDATLYCLTRKSKDYIDPYGDSSVDYDALDITPVVLKFDHRALSTYNLTPDFMLGNNAGLYGYHESYVTFSKLTVAVEVSDNVVTQYYLDFSKNGTATMKKEKANLTVDNKVGTIPNDSSKMYSEPAILDLGFEFTIDNEVIHPNCLFPETYSYTEYKYAKRQGYIITDYEQYKI